MSKRLSILLLITTLLLSCSPKALQEAEEVVAQADSMRVAGQMYADSVHLAQSYNTLRAWRIVRADEYAHACYHYGRLLREKGNPVEAMQCFIAASHAHTHDYHILGRVYSNMGDIAHLAGEFPLAYDMFVRASKAFIRDHDSLSFYYALNNSAFEKACLSEKDSCYIILQTIRQANIKHDSLLTAYCLLTQARSCVKAQQYDSAIYYAKRASLYKQGEPTIIHTIAQSYSYLGEKDSAIYYALKVVNSNPHINELANALYILTNDDDAKDLTAIRETAANRSDVQKQIEIRRAKLSQAVQLLEQDLHRKPNLAWLYAICATILIVGAVVFIYVHKKRRQRTLLAQQINALEEQHEQIVQEHSDYTNKLMAQIEETCNIMNQSPTLTKDLSWNDFESMCHFVDQQFYMIASKLCQKQILNETEMRLCILVLLNLTRKQISETLPYSLNSVGKLKDHTAKLLGTTGKNLRVFLLNLAIER